MSSQYKRYNDLGSTAREKAQQNAVQEQMMQAQETIKQQQHAIEQQKKELETQKKELARRSAFAQREAHARARRASRGGKQDASASASYSGPAAPKVTTRDQKNRMIWSNKICVFKIGAPWCKPCVEMDPQYSALAKLINKPSEVMLFTEHYDRENPNKLSANVEQIPAFDYYYDHKFQHRQTGADFQKLQRNIRMMINQSRNGSDMSVEEESPHPAAGMQPRRRSVAPNSGKYPPSAMRM